MVDCPNCGNKLQTWRVLLVNNLFPTTCQVCRFKLQIKNKAFSSALGGVGGGLNGGLGTLLLILFFQTGNVVFLWLLGVLFASVLLAIGFLMLKYVKLKVEQPNYA